MTQKTDPYGDRNPAMSRVWNMGFDHAKSGGMRVPVSLNSTTAKAYNDGFDAGQDPESAETTTPSFKEFMESDEMKDFGIALLSLTLSLYGRRYIRLTLIEAGVEPVLAKRYSKVGSWAAYIVAANAALGWKVGSRKGVFDA